MEVPKSILIFKTILLPGMKNQSLKAILIITLLGIIISINTWIENGLNEFVQVFISMIILVCITSLVILFYHRISNEINHVLRKFFEK